MSFNANLWLAALSGIIGIIALLIVMYILRLFGSKVDFIQILGSIFKDPSEKASVFAIGLGLCLLYGAFWGFYYIAMMLGLSQQPNIPFGLLFGFAQGLFTGVMLGTLREYHPHYGDGKTFADPGMFGTNWGLSTIFFVVIMNLVFGFVTIFAYLHLYGNQLLPIL